MEVTPTRGPKKMGMGSAGRIVNISAMLVGWVWNITFNVNPGLINPGWWIVVVPPNSDSHGYWNGTPQLNSRLGFINPGLTLLQEVVLSKKNPQWYEKLMESFLDESFYHYYHSGCPRKTQNCWATMVPDPKAWPILDILYVFQLVCKYSDKVRFHLDNTFHCIYIYIYIYLYAMSISQH